MAKLPTTTRRSTNLLLRHIADFPALDREFHTFLIGVLKNRFAEGLNDEIPRNRHALQEHLAILRACLARDAPAALAAMRTHLHSAHTTMLNSIGNRTHWNHQHGGDI